MRKIINLMKYKKRFLKIKEKFKNKKIIFSLANTNGSILNQSYLFDMIRPGIGLYGLQQKQILREKNKTSN